MNSADLAQGSFLALLLMVVMPGAVLAAGEPGAESPEAVVAKARVAYEKEDFGGLAALLTPESRLELAQYMWAQTVIVASSIPSMQELVSTMKEIPGVYTEEEQANLAAEMAKFGLFDELNKKVEELAKKHGLPILDAVQAAKMMGEDPAASLAKVDVDGMIRDFSPLMGTIGQGLSTWSDIGWDLSAKLKRLEIKGDRAHGKLGQADVDFIKLGERWFFSKLPPTPSNLEALEVD